MLLLADDNFFDYLIDKLYDSWSEFHHIISELHDELKRQIYLTVPFVFVPENYQDDNMFFNQWIAINNNKHIILDGKYSYHNKYYGTKDGNWYTFVSHYKLVTDNYTVYGIGREWMRNPDTGTLAMIWNYKYNKQEYKHGKQQRWYLDGTLKEEMYYNDGIITGECKGYYPSGLPKHLYHYNNQGDTIGVFKQWSSDGTLKDDLIIDDNNRHKLHMVNSWGSELLIYRVD